MSNAHNLFCCFVLCIHHFSFSWLQIEERRRKKNLRERLRLMISSRYFCDRKYVYGTDTETMMLWIQAQWTRNEMNIRASLFCFSFHWSLTVCLKWIERNGTHTHNARSVPEKFVLTLLGYCCCWFAAIKWNVFIIFVSAQTQVISCFVFFFVLVRAFVCSFHDIS